MCADAAMRLDRLLTTLAVGSRSQVKTMLRAGRVTVNGQVVRSADAHVQPGDRLTLDQQPLDARTTRHVLLNKPCGVLTSARDSKQPTVLDLLPPAYRACGGEAGYGHLGTAAADHGRRAGSSPAVPQAPCVEVLRGHGGRAAKRAGYRRLRRRA